MALVDKINESDLKTHLLDLLQVPPDVSLRQLKRARDKQIKRYQADYLSENNETSTLAKEKLNKIHLAFESLSSQKKLQENLIAYNRLIKEGQTTKDELLAIHEDDDENRPVLSLVDNVPVITPVVEDSNIIAGPSPGAPIPVQEVNSDTNNNGTPFVNKEEEERIASLKKKQEEKKLQQEKSKANRLESLKTKTIKTIEEAAKKEAKRQVNILLEAGKPDPDVFYELIHEATLAKVEEIKEEQIAKMKRMDLPVNEETVKILNQTCQESAELASQNEYFPATRDAPRKPRVNSSVYLVVTAIAGAAVFLFFTNFEAMMWNVLPDPTANQFKSDTQKPGPSSRPHKVDSSLILSENLAIAKGEGLAPMAGIAGMAGFATTLEIPGSSDYNAALHLAYERNYDKSIKQFEVSLRKNKNLFQTQYNLASLYYWKNDTKSATSAFSKSALLRPDLAQANYNRGVIYLKEALDLTTTLNEKNSNSNQQIDNRKRASKLMQASIIEFNTSIKKAPLMPQSFYNRAIARYTLNDLSGAQEDFTEALRLDTRMDAAQFNIAHTSSKLNNLEITKGNAMPAGPEGPQGPPGPGYL